METIANKLPALSLDTDWQAINDEICLAIARRELFAARGSVFAQKPNTHELAYWEGVNRYRRFRHDEFLPWDACYHFSEPDRACLPLTNEWLSTLPFDELTNIFFLGLSEDHFGALPFKYHETSEEFILACPAGNLRLSLKEAVSGKTLSSPKNPHLLWFPEGVIAEALPDPYFRYCLLIQGKFSRGLLAEIRRH